MRRGCASLWSFAVGCVIHKRITGLEVHDWARRKRRVVGGCTLG